MEKLHTSLKDPVPESIVSSPSNPKYEPFIWLRGFILHVRQQKVMYAVYLLFAYFVQVKLCFALDYGSYSILNILDVRLVQSDDLQVSFMEYFLIQNAFVLI